MSEPTNDTTTDGGTDYEYLRNEPSGTFDAHLFERETVADAGGAVDEQADRPATSVCKVRTAYGPFYEVDADDVAAGELDRDDVCEKCVGRVKERIADDEEDDTEGDA